MNVPIDKVPHGIGALMYLLLFVGLLCSKKDPQTKQADKYLLIMLGTFSLLLFDEFLLYTPIGDALPDIWQCLVSASNLLLGPMIYLYVDHMTHSSKSRPFKWLHFLPFALCFSSLLLITTMDWEQALGEANIIKAVLYSFFVCFACYTLAALKQLKHYQQQSLSYYSQLNEHNLGWVKLWLAYMSVVMVYVVVIVPLLQLSTRTQFFIFDVHYLATLMACYMLLWGNINRQQAMPTQDESIPELSRPEVNETDRLVFEQVELVLEQQQLFLQNGLTLAQLAEATGFSQHQISEAINKSGDTCFYDLVNQKRVQAAQRYLQQSPASKVLDLAFESGFNSKTAFYQAFKKYTGLTPSQYRQQALATSD